MKNKVWFIQFLFILISGCEIFLPDKGHEGQPCLDDGTCLDGLNCIDNICRRGNPCDECHEQGQKTCNGTFIAECLPDQNNCLKWVKRDDCSDDGKWCTVNDRCSIGSCVSERRDCSDDKDCTDDFCDEENKICLHQPKGTEGPPGSASCNDGIDNDCDDLIDTNDPQCISCTQNEQCNDNNTCTIDLCSSGICENRPVTDGTGCTGGSCTSGSCQCESGYCVNAQCSPTNCQGCCTANNQCLTGTEGSACGKNGQNCLDCSANGMICLNQECMETCNSITCSGCCKNGQCYPGTDNNACGSHGNACTVCADDGIYCNGNEVCSAQKVCDHTGNPCAQPGTCYEEGKRCAVCGNGYIEAFLGEECESAAPKNDHCCNTSSCKWVAVNQPDPQGVCPGNECNQGVCNGSGGCGLLPFANGTECGSRFCSGSEWRKNVCLNGSCTSSELIQDCNDNDPCTDDTCDETNGCIYTPNASCGGGKIAFVSDKSGKWEVWVINDDGTGLRQITFEATDSRWLWGAHGPRWSPDGKKIAFYYGAKWNDPNDAPNSRVMIVDEDGSNLREVVVHPGLNPFGIAWSNDGTKLYATSARGCDGDAIVFDVATGNYQTIFDDSNDGYQMPHYVDINPLNQNELSYFAYTCGGGDGGIRRRNLTTGSEVIVSSGGPHHNPRWSPDANQFVFYSEGSSLDRTKFYVVSSAGGAISPVAPAHNGTVVYKPDWMNNGFVFGVWKDNHGELWKCKSDGSEAQVVLSFGDPYSITSFDWYPGRISASGHIDAFASLNKMTSTPILGPSASGWDNNFSHLEDVVESSGSLYMFYSGHSGNQYHQIGLAISTDGLNWSKYSGNPIISYSQHGGAENWQAGVIITDKWHLYRFRDDQWCGSGDIFHAISSDGLSWTNHATNPALPRAATGWDSHRVSAPSIIQINNTYYLWYVGLNFTDGARIGRAVSTDGVTFTRSPTTPVLAYDEQGTQPWENQGVGSPEVIYEDGIYHMWYSGGSSGMPEAIGHAWSYDGIKWYRDPDNPVLVASLTFDQNGVSCPSVIKSGDEFYLYYMGLTSDSRGVGLARFLNSVFMEDFLDAGVVGELIHQRPGWSCEGVSCISTLSSDRYLSPPYSIFLPGAESGGPGVRSSLLNNNFRVEFYFYDGGASGSNYNFVLILDSVPRDSPNYRFAGYNGICHNSKYSVGKGPFGNNPSCIALLGDRSIGWHRFEAKVDYQQQKARFCIDDKCFTDNNFNDLVVGALAFNDDWVDAYVDNFRIFSLPTGGIAPPRPLLPENGKMTGSVHSPAFANTLRPLFRWLWEDDGGGPVTFDLQVDDSCPVQGFASCSFPSPELSQTGITAQSFRPASNLPVSYTAPVGRRYFWRVRACRNSNCSPWSSVRYLDVGRTKGDINGDGYPDVVIGAHNDPGPDSGGRVYVYYGSSPGISTNPSLTIPNPTNHSDGCFGVALLIADVNSDGFSDLIVDAVYQDDGNTDEGQVFVYYGSAGGVSTSPSLTIDNPDDNPYGYFGFSMCAGDINSDGYLDVAIGAQRQDFINNMEGSVFIFNGSSSGIGSLPNQVLRNPENQADSCFYRVGCGDINVDGFSDLLVGADSFDNGSPNEGTAFLYYGSPSGVSLTPALIIDNPENVADGYFGASVDITADVNGDGFIDVLIGAGGQTAVNSHEGRAFLFYGSSQGITTNPDVILENPEHQAEGYFGNTLSSADDVNLDGYDDIIIAAPVQDHGATNEGNAFVYYGSATGISEVPNVFLDNPLNYSTAWFGNCISSATDFNLDGYPDILISAFEIDRVFLYCGSATGLGSTPAVTFSAGSKQSFGAGLPIMR